MKKRYKFTLSKWYYVLFTLAMLILAAAEIVNVLKLIGVGKMQSYNYPLDITACVIMPIIALFIISFIFFSGYTFTEEGIRINLGIIFTTVKYGDIVRLRRDADKTIMIMYYQIAVKDNNAPAPAWQVKQINIKPLYYDEFASLITSRCGADYDIVEKTDKQ